MSKANTVVNILNKLSQSDRRIEESADGLLIRSLSDLFFKDSYRKQTQVDASFVKFERLPLVEEVSNQNCVVRGRENPIFTDGAIGKALQMRPQSSLEVPFKFSKRDRLGISFWLSPHNIKPTANASSQAESTFIMPLMNYAYQEFSDITNNFTVQGGFCIYEECLSDNKNIMHILIDSGSGLYEVRTPPYSAGEFSHFYISYGGFATSLNVYINGQIVELESDTPQSPPNSIFVSVETPKFLQINKDAPGPSDRIRKNSGVLDELYIFNEYIPNSSFISKIINSGVEFVLYSDLANVEQIDLVLGFDDPPTVAVSSVASSGSILYAGKTDGKVVKADRSMWQARRDFANKEEIKFIEQRKSSENSEISHVDGSLQTHKSFIRL